MFEQHSEQHRHHQAISCKGNPGEMPIGRTICKGKIPIDDPTACNGSEVGTKAICHHDE